MTLLLDENTPEAAKQRLQAFTETSDGFELAELDFQTRGPGEMLGTRQHGIPALRIADFRTDQQVLELARTDARTLIERDPTFASPEFDRLRQLVMRRYGRLLELGDVG